MTSVLTDTCATVVCQYETIGAVAEAALWRWVAEILTAEGGTAFQACEEKTGVGEKSNYHQKEDFGFTLMIHFSATAPREAS